MRRFTLSSIVAVLTFALSLGVTRLSYQFIPPTISLCELARHPDRYDQQVVRVAASASGFHESVVISADECEAEEAWAVVLLAESFNPGPEVESFLTGSTSEIRKASVFIVGRFNQHASPGCFGPRFGIHVNSVELTSPVTFEPFPRRGE